MGLLVRVMTVTREEVAYEYENFRACWCFGRVITNWNASPTWRR